MKKLLLASAIAALSISAAQAAPTIYGKAFLTLDLNDGDSNSSAKDSRSQLNSTGSRIGFKGSEALTATTDLVYQLEYRLDIDDNVGSGSDANFEARDTYIGLSNKKYGTAVAGRLTAIDDYINYASVVNGGVIGGDSVLTAVDGPRGNNAFAYFTPDYNGLQIMTMYAMDEMKNSTDLPSGNDSLNGDAFGLGAKYEPTNKPYKAGITYLRASQAGAGTDASGLGEALTAIRVSGAYAVSPVLTAAALYQHTDLNTADNENAFALSAKYKTRTPWAVYGQLDVVTNVAGASDADKQRIAVGGEYDFNKNTTGHLYGAILNEEAAGVDATSYGIGAGIEYKF